MKKLLIWVIVLGGIILGSCTKDDDSNGVGGSGSIYGIVTEGGTAEPIRGVNIVLYRLNGVSYDKNAGVWDAESGIQVSSATTYDDGHFEFKDLQSGVYAVGVVNDPRYDGGSDPISVEAGKQTKVDVQLEKKYSSYPPVY